MGRLYNNISISIGTNLIEKLDKITEKEKEIYLQNCKTKKEKRKCFKTINRSLIADKLIKAGIEIRGAFLVPYGVYGGKKTRISITIDEELDKKIEKIVEDETKRFGNPGTIPVNKGRVIEDLITKGITAIDIGI